MASFAQFVKDLLGGSSSNQDNAQRDMLALTRFEGVCRAFEQMESQIPVEWLKNGVPVATDTISQRAAVFYALASARMQLAQQLHVSLLEDQKTAQGQRASQARLDLEELINQLDVLILATQSELVQSNSTEGAWEERYRLREVLNTSILTEESEESEDSLAHVQAVHNGTRILLEKLQQELHQRQQTSSTTLLTGGKLFLAEAQHAFDTLTPLAAQLNVRPGLFVTHNSAVHKELESRLHLVTQLLERAAAELAVPGVTKTSFWKNLVGEPQLKPSNAAVSSAQPWKQDIWCMTSPLFMQTNSNNRRAEQAVRKMWQADPDPAKTWKLYLSIINLERQGATSRKESYYSGCPWVDIWQANQNVQVGQEQVRRGQEFTLHVEAEADGSFNRQIIVANFESTDTLDYCDTEEEGGH